MAEHQNTSARNLPSKKLMAQLLYHLPGPVTQLKKLLVKMKKRRRLFTLSANNRGSQRATDSQCHYNCMMLSLTHSRFNPCATFLRVFFSITLGVKSPRKKIHTDAILRGKKDPVFF